MVAQCALAGARERSRYWDGPCSGKYYRFLLQSLEMVVQIFFPHTVWNAKETIAYALGADPALYKKIPTADLEEENQE